MIWRIIKWLSVIFTLVFLPGGGLILLVLSPILYFFKRLSSLELLLVTFLMYFSTNGLLSLGVFQNGRFVLLVIVLLSSVKNSSVNLFDFVLQFKSQILWILFIIFHSVFVSVQPLYSLQQGLIFALLLFTTAVGGKKLKLIGSGYDISSVFESFYLAIIVASILVFPLKNISFARNGVGFQGFSVHPNALGVVLAPYVAFCLFRFVNSKSMKDIILIVVNFIILFLTQSRTSVIAALISVVFILIISKKIDFKIIFLGIVIVFFVFFSPFDVQSSLIAFFSKSSGESVLSSMEASRGSLIELQIKNIENKPLLGNGFKIPSDFVSGMNLGLESGQINEKGNFFFALTEEMGLIGFCLFLFFLSYQFKFSNVERPDLLILPITAVLTNLGESTMFSIGGIGLLVWIFIFSYRYATN